MGRKCSIENCTEKHHSKGYCSSHYWTVFRGKDPLKLKRKKSRNRVCSIPTCGQKHWGRNFCRKHFTRLLNHGDPNTVKVSRDHSNLCAVIGCDEKYQAKGYCAKHIYRVRRWGDPNISRTLDVEIKCLVPHCETMHKGKSGFCAKHSYLRKSAKEISKKYRNSQKGRAAQRSKKAKRRAIELSSIIPATNFEEIKKIYLARGDDQAVDHIIPLIHPDVCGLHVHWNMQFLSRSENASKANQFDGTSSNEGWRKSFLKLSAV